MTISSLKNNIHFAILALLFANTLTYSDLQQKDNSWNYSYSLMESFSLGGNKNTNGQTAQGGTSVFNTGSGSTTIGASNSGFNKEGVAVATVGGGNITTTSNIDGLNRDETQSMLVTKNERTGGLDGSLTIDNQILTDPKGYMESVISGVQKMPEFAGKATNTYNTMIGLTYGAIGYALGKIMGKDVGVNIGHNAIQFTGNPLGDGDSALTLGNSINYFNDAKPDDKHPTYKANEGRNWTQSSYDSIILGDHEEQHTYQGEKYGILFLPWYFAGGGISSDNKAEQQADDRGNKSYIEKYGE